MPELDLIVAALAAGASTVATATANSAAQDIYQTLKERLRARFAGRPEAQGKLYTDRTRPDEWHELLGTDLVESGATADPEVLAAARALLDSKSPEINVYVAGDVNGQQSGNFNHQKNYFGSTQQN